MKIRRSSATRPRPHQCHDQADRGSDTEDEGHNRAHVPTGINSCHVVPPAARSFRGAVAHRGCSSSGATDRERAVGRRPAGGLHIVFSSNYRISQGSDTGEIVLSAAKSLACLGCVYGETSPLYRCLDISLPLRPAGVRRPVSIPTRPCSRVTISHSRVFQGWKRLDKHA